MQVTDYPALFAIGLIISDPVVLAMGVQCSAGMYLPRIRARTYEPADRAPTSTLSGVERYLVLSGKGGVFSVLECGGKRNLRPET